MIATGLTTDHVVFWRWGPVALNATIVHTWVVMAVLAVGSWLATRRLSTGPTVSRWQNLLEVVVGYIRREIRSLTNLDPNPYVPFVGTLFIFIAASTLLDLVPGFTTPVLSLSTTAAMAICVFVAVPVYGVANRGLAGYLGAYLKPSPFMLPFNLIGELSRTLALAVRLGGNMLSGGKIAGILLSLVPFLLEAAWKLFGLLLGAIQAYVFAMLAMVYISSGMRSGQARAAKAPARARPEEDLPAESANDPDRKGPRDD